MAKGEEKASKVAQMQALGLPGIFRQVEVRRYDDRGVKIRGVMDAESGPLVTANGKIGEMAREIEHLTAEVARLKREIASRLQASTVASTASTPSTAPPEDVDAERRRLRTERQKRWRQNKGSRND